MNTTSIRPAIWKKIIRHLGSSACPQLAFRIPSGATMEGELLVVVVEGMDLPKQNDLRRQFDLTRRETEVAGLMAGRLSDREIADLLGISIHTARRHAESALKKIGVQDRRNLRAALMEAKSPVRRSGVDP